MRHYNILDISIYQIQLFLTVAEEKNFSRAADLLNLTQPTLSKRIFALEDILGFPLFDRKQRPIALTEAGETLYVEWKDFIRRFEESVEKTRVIFEQSYRQLKVGMIDSSRSIEAINRTARQLEEENPGLAVMREYKSYNRWREMVSSGEVDVMFMLTIEVDKLDETTNHEVVMTCPKLVAMLRSNPLSNKEAITYEDLKSQKFVINSPKAMATHYDFIRENTLKHGFEPNVSRFTPTTHDLIGSLKHDDEVVVCDVFLRDIDSNDLKVFELPDTYSGMMAVWRRDNPNPFISRYVQLAKENFEHHPPTIP